jgi:hypothetical protein
MGFGDGMGLFPVYVGPQIRVDRDVNAADDSIQLPPGTEGDLVSLDSLAAGAESAFDTRMSASPVIQGEGDNDDIVVTPEAVEAAQGVMLSPDVVGTRRGRSVVRQRQPKVSVADVVQRAAQKAVTKMRDKLRQRGAMTAPFEEGEFTIGPGSMTVDEGEGESDVVLSGMAEGMAGLFKKKKKKKKKKAVAVAIQAPSAETVAAEQAAAQQAAAPQYGGALAPAAQYPQYPQYAAPQYGGALAPAAQYPQYAPMPQQYEPSFTPVTDADAVAIPEEQYGQSEVVSMDEMDRAQVVPGFGNVPVIQGEGDDDDIVVSPEAVMEAQGVMLSPDVVGTRRGRSVVRQRQPRVSPAVADAVQRAAQKAVGRVRRKMVSDGMAPFAEDDFTLTPGSMSVDEGEGEPDVVLSGMGGWFSKLKKKVKKVTKQVTKLATKGALLPLKLTPEALTLKALQKVTAKKAAAKKSTGVAVGINVPYAPADAYPLPVGDTVAGQPLQYEPQYAPPYTPAEQYAPMPQYPAEQYAPPEQQVPAPSYDLGEDVIAMPTEGEPVVMDVSPEEGGFMGLGSLTRGQGTSARLLRLAKAAGYPASDVPALLQRQGFKNAVRTLRRLAKPKAQGGEVSAAPARPKAMFQSGQVRPDVYGRQAMLNAEPAAPSNEPDVVPMSAVDRSTYSSSQRATRVPYGNAGGEDFDVDMAPSLPGGEFAEPRRVFPSGALGTRQFQSESQEESMISDDVQIPVGMAGDKFMDDPMRDGFMRTSVVPGRKSYDTIGGAGMPKGVKAEAEDTFEQESADQIDEFGRPAQLAQGNFAGEPYSAGESMIPFGRSFRGSRMNILDSSVVGLTRDRLGGRMTVSPVGMDPNLLVDGEAISMELTGEEASDFVALGQLPSLGVLGMAVIDNTMLALKTREQTLMTLSPAGYEAAITPYAQLRDKINSDYVAMQADNTKVATLGVQWGGAAATYKSILDRAISATQAARAKPRVVTQVREVIREVPAALKQTIFSKYGLAIAVGGAAVLGGLFYLRSRQKKS